MSNKEYLDVEVLYTKNGQMMPMRVIGNDGLAYDVDKVTDVRRACSFGAGGCGIKYTCYIEGQMRNLFFGDEKKWFIENLAY